jgi:hypothetical protein
VTDDEGTGFDLAGLRARWGGRWDELVLTYRLDADHTVIPEPDMQAWGAWFEDWQGRIVAQDEILYHGRPLFVSTVCVGVDQNYSLVGPPWVFETMVFEMHEDGSREAVDYTDDFGMTDRYATWAEALAGHHLTLTLLRDDLGA